MKSKQPLSDIGAATEVLQGEDTRSKRQITYRWANEDLIPHVRIGRRKLLFDLDLLREFLRRGGSHEPGEWRRMLDAA